MNTTTKNSYTKILIVEDAENKMLTVYSTFEKGIEIITDFDTFDDCWDYVKLKAKESGLTMEDIQIKFLRDIIRSHMYDCFI